MVTLDHKLAAILARNWWVLMLRGLVAILFGIMAWMRPSLSLTALVMLFGVYTLVDGTLGVWAAIMGRKAHEDWWVLMLWGLISVGIGFMTFAAPVLTAMALLFYIAIWAVATGVLQIVAAIRLRREVKGEWMLILGGLASVLLGMLLMMQPGAGALALLWLIAAYAVVFGVILEVLAFKARGFGHRIAH